MSRSSWNSSKYSPKQPLATIAEIEVPTCRDGWVTIKPASYGHSCNASTVAGDDQSKNYHDGWRACVRVENDCFSTPSKDTRDLNRDMAGVVEEVGLGVSQFAKGQSVVLMPSQSSYDSLDGHEHGENIFTHSNGVYSAPSACLYPLPTSISLRSATYLAALATAYHALLHTSPFRPLDNVLIISSNPVSLFLVRLLSLQNAYQIIVVEHNPVWRRLAIQFGATHVLNPKDIDVSESVRLLTDDIGADVVFHIADQCDYETSQDITATSPTMLRRSRGMTYAVTSAILACRTRGTIVNIAPRKMYEASKSKFRNKLMMHEVQYMGSAEYDITSLKAAVDLMERGDVKFDGFSLA